ncbi:hypothetical protein BU14_0125s0033 [Porphyra umbilicalis]|uniref:FAD-binding domain-containing protein n=1 Tax=Porphyra umbilicalis TaxID=2786 RepID=A0A1X6PBC5_PORUM|nr:hypothetical protein BU14_0125s0033 [Porphyra umbilicalis]|eukprot:OSX78045.1 hypothetical protein BU14_0125s0033 [Porphyra umbilicalis]
MAEPAPAADPPEGTADEPLLSCRLDTARILADALACIATPARKGAVVVLSVPEHGGLRLAVEDAGCLQARVVLRKSVFAQFTVRRPDVAAHVALGPLLDCLNLFSGFWDKHPTALQLIYVGQGHPLVLLLQEKDTLTQCTLATIDGTGLTDFAFARDGIQNHLMIASPALRECLLELDYGGATHAELRLSAQAPHFRFRSPAPLTLGILTGASADSAVGAPGGGGGGTPAAGMTPAAAAAAAAAAAGTPSATGGSPLPPRLASIPQCDIVLPAPDDGRGGSGPLTKFTIRATQVSSYRLALLRRAVRALGHSEYTKIRTNFDGMLSLAIQLRVGGASGIGGGGGGGVAAAAAWVQPWGTGGGGSASGGGGCARRGGGGRLCGGGSGAARPPPAAGRVVPRPLAITAACRAALAAPPPPSSSRAALLPHYHGRPSTGVGGAGDRRRPRPLRVDARRRHVRAGRHARGAPSPREASHRESPPPGRHSPAPHTPPTTMAAASAAKPARIAIVGAGIGGLATALALLRTPGVDARSITLLDGRADLDTATGGALNVTGGSAVLSALGVDVRASGAPLARVVARVADGSAGGGGAPRRRRGGGGARHAGGGGDAA